MVLDRSVSRRIAKELKNRSLRCCLLVILSVRVERDWKSSRELIETEAG